MYSVSNDFKTAMLRPVIQSKITGTVNSVSFTDENIIAGSLRITAQNAQQDEISIGTASSRELTITFAHALGLVRTTLQKKAIVLSYHLLVGETWEAVPLGTYYIDEASWTFQGIKCRAFDAMGNFDKQITEGTVYPTSGKAYDFLSWASLCCGVTLGMTQAAIEAMTNGNISVNYLPGNVKTYRDYIAAVAGMLGCFALISRSNELVLRKYSRTSCATYTPTDRLTGASFSDFVTQYAGFMIYDDGASAQQIYQDDEVDGLLMDMGANPFMQGNETIRENLTTEITSIAFTPHQVSMNIPPIHDLGDCLTFSGGIGDTELHTLNYISWTYHKSMTLTGYGKNPAFAQASTAKAQERANVQGAITSLTNKVENAWRYGVVFLAPTVPDIDDIPKNLDPIDDGEAGEVAYFHFVVTQEKAPVAVHAVVEIDAETTAENDIYGDCLATITVSSDIGVLGTQTEAFGDGLHVLNVDTIKKYFEDGEHDINIELALAGGYAAVNKLKLRTAYLETRARMYKQETLTIYEGFVSGAMELSNCLVTDLNGCVDCGANSQSGINFYSEYFLTGQALAYRTMPNGNFWRINQNFADEKWRSLPISFTIRVGETDVPFVCEQVSGAPIYATVIQDLGEGQQLVIASHYGTGDSQIRRTDTDVVFAHGVTVLTAEGLSGTTYYNTGPYDYPGGENAIKEALVASDHIYDVTEADPVKMEGWKTREYALNDFGGLDENERDHLGRYPNRVLLNYKTSGGVSYMYIPIARAEGWQSIIAKVKLYQTVEGSDYNAVGIGAGAVVEGQMVEVLETTDSESWTTISADISDLPYVDYIILYGRDGAQGIRSVWLWKEDGIEEEY